MYLVNKQLKCIKDANNKEYSISIPKEKIFWKYCTNNKFIEIIEKTIYKPYKKVLLIQDPFEKLLTKDIENMSDKEYDEFTYMKDRQKSRQNDIGLFKQHILGACYGWTSSNIGVDLVNEKLSIIIEIKNKFNTLNSSSREHTLKKLHNLSYKYKCYLGHIIPKTISYTKKNSKYNVTEICGEHLYELITGSKNSEKELIESVKYYQVYRKEKKMKYI